MPRLWSQKGMQGQGVSGKTKVGMAKFASLNKICSSEMNSRQKKHIGKKSNVRPTDNCTNGKERNSIAKGLGSCEMIETETTKNDSGENQQVNNENSIPSLKSKQPTLVIVNCLGYKLGDKDIRGLRRKSPTLLKAKSKGLVKNAKNKDLESKSKTYSPAPVHECSVLEKSDENLSSRRTDQDNQAAAVGCHSTEVKSGKGGKKVIGALQNMCLAAGSLRNNNLEEYNDSDSNARDDLTPEKEKEVVRPQLDYSSCDELQQRSMVAAVTRQSTLHDDAMDEVIPCPPTCLLAKENIENQNMQSEQIENQNRKENQTEPLNLPSECIENQNRQENQTEPLNLFDQAHSSSSAKFLPEDSSAEMKTSLEFVKDNTRKRKQLILLDGYDGEEKKAGDVQPENNDPRCEKCDTPMKNNEIENTVQTGDLCNVNLSDGMPVKKRRRYVDAYKDRDDDAVIDVANGSSALVMLQIARLVLVQTWSHKLQMQKAILLYPE